MSAYRVVASWDFVGCFVSLSLSIFVKYILFIMKQAFYILHYIIS